MQREVFDYSRLAALVLAGEIFEVKIRSRVVYAEATFPRGFFLMPGAPSGTPIPVTPGGVCYAPQPYVERWFLKFGTRNHSPILLDYAAGEMGIDVFPVAGATGSRVLPVERIWSTCKTALQDEPVSPPYPGGQVAYAEVPEAINDTVYRIPVGQFAPCGCEGMTFRAYLTPSVSTGRAGAFPHPACPHWCISHLQSSGMTAMPLGPRGMVRLGAMNDGTTGLLTKLYASWSFPGRFEPNDTIYIYSVAPAYGQDSSVAGALELWLHPRATDPQEPFQARLAGRFSDVDPTTANASAIAEQVDCRPVRVIVEANGGVLTAGAALLQSVSELTNTAIDSWDMMGLDGIVTQEPSPSGAYWVDFDAVTGGPTTWFWRLQ